ncbi:hypothetical protein FKW77_002716 [Venturia effusa]|uniref:tRNA(Phe) (4-demethylwyosine(37)-C(7)) aminocarboxypropyltransferase n=1 Tax=Venturia effusa TaxID=50376 RepID=A0A517LC27_9PEZI|nr:hypothetical protein FKW77_002716 [Venturia effusa]
MAVSCVSLIVPKQCVKRVKTALEVHGKLDKREKISPCTAFHSGSIRDPMLVPTTINMVARNSGPDLTLYDEYKRQLLAELGLENLLDSISICEAPRELSDGGEAAIEPNPLTKAVRAYLSSVSSEFWSLIDITIDSLLAKLPTTYSLYPPMLLLPAHVFSAPDWKKFLSNTTCEQQTGLYQAMATAMNVTHIAINATIPPLSKDQDHSKSENILRSPTNLTPLYGDFGPICKSPSPTSEDFASAFWVSAKQNGITQIWAPRYTMFSRGNITEKARLLRLPSVIESVEEEAGCTVIDMYAGIGYFAFSYARAGASKLLCFELNPWSVEGLRRGAEANGWGIEIFNEEDIKDFKPTFTQLRNPKAKFLVFQMSNEAAGPILYRISGAIPPVRHVNCGLLPSSRGSWATSARILNPEIGGWIHIHENLAINEIEAKSEEIAAEVQELLDAEPQSHAGLKGRKLITIPDHVERVKTFAPGIMHCVLDVHVVPFITKG